jgi:hypothetical protein
VEDIALRRPTLDEVFLALTGHDTTAGGDGGDGGGRPGRKNKKQAKNETTEEAA